MRYNLQKFKEKSVEFYKYCASGNDFVIYADEGKKDRSELAKMLCDRHSGIGADGLIAILPSCASDENGARQENASDKARQKCEISQKCSKNSAKQKPQNYDFEWDFYNRDGSAPLMCGNGARAAAHFAVHFLGKSTNLAFLTKAGLIEASVEKNSVEIALGVVKDEKAPFEFGGKIWQGCDTGVPHLVHFCKDLDEFDLRLCQSVREKFNANVNFAQIISPTHLRVRTYERGVEDETLACGTGMAASFYLAHKNKALQNSVLVEPKSGERLNLRYENGQIFFKGEVRCCFEAKYHFS